MELEQATDPLADSIPSMLNAQIAHNLLLKDDNIEAIPGQIIIASGSSQVSNQLILPTAGLTSIGRLFSTFSLQNQNQWQQGWSITAVTDVGDLQRLDALYRFAWRQGTICDFVNRYSKAVIVTSGSQVLRLTDFGDTAMAGNMRKQDFNAEDPPAPKYIRGKDTLPKTMFGPPAGLPLPPLSVVQKCAGPGPRTLTGDDAPDRWPVPFPARGNFIGLAGSKLCREHPDQCTVLTEAHIKSAGQHELNTMWVRSADYAKFQLWVLGATVNTSSAGKGGGSSPSKGISGSTG